jgi:hypothetical protein
VINRNAAVSVALASANSYTDGAVSSLSTAVANNISTVVLNTSTNLSNAISTEVSDRNAALSTSVSNLSTAVSIALAVEESTARSAELSLASLISVQTSTTVSNISAALSTNTANRITYQSAATVKFNSIQQAFDVIFDAIDIEKYQDSAPDYFEYDATVQELSAPPAGPIMQNVYIDGIPVARNGTITVSDSGNKTISMTWVTTELVDIWVRFNGEIIGSEQQMSSENMYNSSAIYPEMTTPGNTYGCSLEVFDHNTSTFVENYNFNVIVTA